MNPFRRKQEPDRIRPDEQVFACPDCGSNRPAASILLLRNWVRRAGTIVGLVTGERVACQDCPCVYSIGPAGIFRHSRQSLPITPQAPQNAPTRPEEPLEERPLPPMPLKPPRL